MADIDDIDDIDLEELFGGSCWQCGGEGHLGSACVDDLCHGGEVPCMHGDLLAIPCRVCEGGGDG